MRIGPSYQAGSDSLLTAATFFKMRELYFNDQIDDAEYNGKLYGLGQTFTFSNGMADSCRGGATLAEREDRGSTRETHNQTPAMGVGQNQMNMAGTTTGGTAPTPLPTTTPYAPIASNGYIRTTMVGGGR
jgi:CCR4-NOT transcription complex subunit 7/8